MKIRTKMTTMSEPEKKRKKKRKSQSTILLEQQEEKQELAELVQVLDELEKEGKYVEIQVCPHCKSPKIRRVESMSGDIFGHMGLTPPKFECSSCGWREKLILKATNKPTTIKDVAIMAEARELENEKPKEKNKSNLPKF